MGKDSSFPKADGEVFYDSAIGFKNAQGGFDALLVLQELVPVEIQIIHFLNDLRQALFARLSLPCFWIKRLQALADLLPMAKKPDPHASSLAKRESCSFTLHTVQPSGIFSISSFSSYPER